MMGLPVAGYFRVSQARDDMRAPDMYRDDIEREPSSVVLASLRCDLGRQGRKA